MASCSGVNKAGEPCGAHPLHGTERCLAHTPGASETVGFGGPQEGSGRPKTISIREAMRGRIEAEIDRWISPLEDALTAMTPGYTDSDGDYHEGVPDHRIRLQAAREIREFVEGRPRQMVEHSGPDGGPITIADLARSASSQEEP